MTNSDRPVLASSSDKYAHDKVWALYKSQAQECLANKAFDKGQWHLCEGLLRDALEKRQEALGNADSRSGAILDRLGQTYQFLNQLEQAAATFASAITLLEKAFYVGHASLAPVLEHSADCLIAQGQWADAEPFLKRALEINEKTLANEHRSTLRCVLKLSDTFLQLKRPAESEALLLKSMKFVETPLGPAEEFRYQVAVACLQQNKNEQAIEQIFRAIGVFRQRHNYGRLADCYDVYVQALTAVGRLTEAGSAKLEAVRFKLLSNSHPYVHDILSATYLRS